MIEGLKIRVDGSEMLDLCRGRAKYHRSRAEVYGQQISNMQSSQVEGMAYTNGNPIQNLTDRRTTHENEAAEMDFIADHIACHETYELDNADLVKLGIAKGRY